MSDEPAPLRWLLRRMVRWLPGLVVANSQATADALAWPRHGRAATRLAVIPNGVDHFPARAVAAGADGPLRVAVLGRVSGRKGWREALGALALVQADGGDVTLDWFGSAPDDDPGALERAREQVARLGLRGRATFHGHVDDAAEQLAAFDVLLMPSQRPESFSLALLEGMAAGCAVVAVRCGGGSDALVDHGRSGLLCDPDAGSIAAALMVLAADRGLVRSMRERGRTNASGYTASAMRQAVHTIWQTAAERREAVREGVRSRPAPGVTT